MVAPEAGEVLRDLDGPLAGGEDMHQHRHAPHGDARRSGHAEELLDAEGDVWRIGRIVDHFGGPAVRQGQAFRGVLLEERLLCAAEPAFHHSLDGLVLEILAAEGTVADLLHQVASILFADGRQLQFRAPLAQEVQPQDPLFQAFVPVLEFQPAGDDLIGQQPGGRIGRGRFDAAGANRQVAEAQLLLRIDAAGGGVIEDSWLRLPGRRGITRGASLPGLPLPG